MPKFVLTAKRAIKEIILKRCSLGLQHKLRRMHVVREILHDQHVREPEMVLLASLSAKNDWVADVGANIGVYTKELSGIVGPVERVFSFEPLGENYDILTTLRRRADLSNVCPFRAALGAKMMLGEIVIPDMNGFTGYYWDHIAQPGENGRRETVEILTLDELYSHQVIPRLNFVKCDVEGGELEVILGGR